MSLNNIEIYHLESKTMFVEEQTHEIQEVSPGWKPL